MARKGKKTKGKGGALHARQLRKEAIAQVFAVHVQTVLNWARSGCPHERRRKRSPYLFDASEVAKWLRKKGRDGRPGRPAEKASRPREAAMLRKETALADRYELDLAERRGRLIPAEQAEQERIVRILAVKGGLEELKETLPAELVGRSMAEIKRALQERFDGLLRRYAADGGDGS